MTVCSWADIVQIIFLSNVVSFRQHRLDNISMQSEPLEQHCTEYLPMSCCPKSIKTPLNRIFSCAMLSSASRTTLHKNFPVQCCPRRSHSWGNIAQIKTLCSVVYEAPDNNAQEKILFYVVLILLGQHYIGKNPMQCWTWGSRQQCTEKNPGNVFWTTSGHSAYKYSSGPSCQKKKDKLSFLYCENRLTS